MILSVILIVVVIAFITYNKPHLSVKNEDAAFGLSVSELVDAFSSDETEATSRYAGKVLEVRGNLKEVIRSNNTTILLMGDSTRMTGVSCYLQSDEKTDHATLKPGETVTVKGICNGMLIDVVLDKAILIDE